MRQPNLLEDAIAVTVGLILLAGVLMGAFQGCEEIRRQHGKECYEKTRSEECWK